MRGMASVNRSTPRCVLSASASRKSSSAAPPRVRRRAAQAQHHEPCLGGQGGRQSMGVIGLTLEEQVVDDAFLAGAEHLDAAHVDAVIRDQGGESGQGAGAVGDRDPQVEQHVCPSSARAFATSHTSVALRRITTITSRSRPRFRLAARVGVDSVGSQHAASGPDASVDLGGAVHHRPPRRRHSADLAFCRRLGLAGNACASGRLAACRGLPSAGAWPGRPGLLGSGCRARGAADHRVERRPRRYLGPRARHVSQSGGARAAGSARTRRRRRCHATTTGQP